MHGWHHTSRSRFLNRPGQDLHGVAGPEESKCPGTAAILASRSMDLDQWHGPNKSYSKIYINIIESLMIMESFKYC